MEVWLSKLHINLEREGDGVVVGSKFAAYQQRAGENGFRTSHGRSNRNLSCLKSWNSAQEEAMLIVLK